MLWLETLIWTSLHSDKTSIKNGCKLMSLLESVHIQAFQQTFSCVHTFNKNIITLRQDMSDKSEMLITQCPSQCNFNNFNYGLAIAQMKSIKQFARSHFKYRFWLSEGKCCLLASSTSQALGPTQPPTQMISGKSFSGGRGGESNRSVKLITHFHLVLMWRYTLLKYMGKVDLRVKHIDLCVLIRERDEIRKRH
jgi:hypothetical protein